MSASRAFAKLVGAGNDFLFLDARGGQFAQPRPALVAKLCDRHFGVGADGVVFVEGGEAASGESRKADGGLRWDFYNSDGSGAEMCGNAARCFVRWAQARLQINKIEFKTAAGDVRGETLADGRVLVELPFVDRAANALSAGPHLAAAVGAGPVWLINSGVPHAVLEAANMAEARANRRAIEALRWLPEAGPRGANVTFFARRGENEIDSVTFERGVEGFTLACGTGVIAAALAFSASGDAGPGRARVAVSVPGGRLEARLEGTQEGRGVSLLGPADFVCEGECAEELMR